MKRTRGGKLPLSADWRDSPPEAVLVFEWSGWSLLNCDNLNPFQVHFSSIDFIL